MVVGGKLVNNKSVEGKLVILAKMGGKLVNCRKFNVCSVDSFV